ncbi:MAG TPA: hypothetical protein VIG08_09890 [Gemmatimonadales bacterium]|jgi:hypothetical protein
MRTAVLLCALLSTAIVSPVLAQAAECTPFSGDAERVCTAAVDATRAFHPLLGGLVSGGNPVFGTGGPLGSPGRFAITPRVNAMEIVLPDLSYDGSSNTVPAGDKVFAPAPLIEAAVGLYGGLPSGLLAVDVLGSAQLLPTSVLDHFTVDNDARRIGDVALGLGYGLRVGILKETGPLPGVAVSVMRRDIPTITYGSIADGDEFQYSVDLHATNLRLTVGKQLGVIGLAGGIGWDKYTGNGLIRVPTALQPADFGFRLKTSRATAFLDAGLGLGVVTLNGEAGYQTGKDQDLTTDFEDFDTTKGKFYAGLGLRVGL